MGLKYYSNINDAMVPDLFIQPSIKTESQLMDFSVYGRKGCPDTSRITGAYIIFFQSRSIDHDTHVTGLVSQSSAESEYNEACTEVIDLAHFRVLIIELLNKDPDIVPKKNPLIILDIKSAICMAKNGMDTKKNKANSKDNEFSKAWLKVQDSQDWLV